MVQAQDRNIYISTSALVKLVLAVILFAFLYLIKDILALFFVALVISTAITPTMQSLEQQGIRKVITMIFIYVVLLAIAFFLFISFVPLVMEQGFELIQHLQSYLDNVKLGTTALARYNIDLNKGVESFVDSIASLFRYSVSAIITIFDNIISFTVIIVATFYMTLEVESINKTILFFVPDKRKEYINQLINKIRIKTGMWLRGQLALCVIVGVLAYIGLWFFNIKYALILALLFGVGELIPYLGPTIAAIPAIFLAFVQEKSLAVTVIGLYIVIQILENNFIVPAVMKRAVGLSPIITIFALLIGGKLAGVTGMVLAIPVVTAVHIILTSYFEHKEQMQAIDNPSNKTETT